MIYFDQAATSYPKPDEVVMAVTRAMRDSSASPGRSAHEGALTASRCVFNAREAVAEFFGVEDSSRIAFTLNVTQALNIVLQGMLQPGDRVLTTSMEHNSVLRPLGRLAATRGVILDIIEADGQGFVDPDTFADRLTPDTRLAVVNHASNITGTLADLKAIKINLDGIPLIVDAAQSAGALPLSPVEDIADVICFTGHKGLLGPTGTGGLYVRPGLDIPPLFQGGTGSRSELEEQPDFMPDALEAGTPNTHGLAGLAEGISFLSEIGADRVRDHEISLIRRFLDGLASIPDITAYGPPKAENRVAVISLNIKGWSPSDLAHRLNRDYFIATRAGLHCAPRAHRTIGTFPQGAVRFSMGWFNTPGEVDRVLHALDRLSREAAP